MPASEEVHAYLISIGYVARVREEKSWREDGKLTCCLDGVVLPR